ncbi:unnamed protein product [Moneuplotes crassus]|uniref:Uncharacterized protein n=1 Tax=Euplotes crassus TaxID=5936 RepID=A0AAD2D8R4_EUPCR|nr:unnamed protein product [Moneuplotes crassus]
MTKFPDCDRRPKCKEISYVVRKNDTNPLKEDMFIFSKCMATSFCGEHCEPITPLEPIEECLDLAHFNIEKITEFRDQYKLHKNWDGLNGELEDFRKSFLDLNHRFRMIRRNNQRGDLAKFLIDARAFLNMIMVSRVMEYYSRELQVRTFDNYKKGPGLRQEETQAYWRAKLDEQQRTIQRNQIAPLREQLNKSNEEVKQSKDQIENLEQENTRLEEEVKTLTEDNTNNEMQAKIEELTVEEARKTSQIEELKQEILSLEESLESSHQNLTHSDLKAIHNSFTNSSSSFDSSSTLQINLTTASHLKLVKALQLCTLPPLKHLYIDDTGDLNKGKGAIWVKKNKLRGFKVRKEPIAYRGRLEGT